MKNHRKIQLSKSYFLPFIFYFLSGLTISLVSYPARGILVEPRLIVQNEAQKAQADSFLQLGEQQLNRREFKEAAESFQQALKISRELQENDWVNRAEIGLAKASLLMGDYPQAIRLFSQILPRERANGYRAETILSNLGLALFLSGQTQAAEPFLKEAIVGWESIRALDNDDINKITLFEQQAHTYRLLQKVLVAQRKTDAALELAEASRARALVEQLVQSKGNLKSPNIEQIKQIAKAHNTTLVEYSIVGNEIRVLGDEPEEQTDVLIWVIKPNGEVIFRQVSLQQRQGNYLSRLIIKTREEAIGVRGRGIAVAARVSGTEQPTQLAQLQQLHQLLIQPIAEFLPTDPNARITFIPQGFLFLVPFAALQDSNGKYLIEKHTITIAPSIQVLDLTHQAKQAISPTGNSLIVGNPIMPSIPGEPPQQLASLPGSEREAIAIASILNTKPIIGTDATKSAVLQQLNNARIIHLATHGLLDIDANLNEFGEPTVPVRTARESNVFINPGAVTVGPNVMIGGVRAELSLAREKVVRVAMPGAIALAPSGNDNGFLTAKEIAGMKLNAELVVLSACDTGRGRVTGDGIIGLSRAFIAAGVPSVIVSLWAVPDAPTANLMTVFYQNLQQKQDKAQALRQAMLATMKQHPNPRDWAAFTLVGEPF